MESLEKIKGIDMDANIVPDAWNAPQNKWGNLAINVHNITKFGMTWSDLVYGIIWEYLVKA